LAMTCFATGNNVIPAADTARRISHIRLESSEERPEERQNFAHSNLLVWVKDNRPELLRAALTILAAFHQAHRPDQHLTAWGSFEGWTALVGNAVGWAGLDDPGDTRAYLREQSDAEHQNMCLLLERWQVLDEDGKGLTAGEVVRMLDPPPPQELTSDLSEMR